MPNINCCSGLGHHFHPGQLACPRHTAQRPFLHRNRICPSLAGGALAAAVLTVHAQVSIATSAFTYQQNFDTLAVSGTAQAWANNSTLSGWYLFDFRGTAVTTYAAGTGSLGTGSFYSFGTGTAIDRALGGVGSGGSYFGSPSGGSVAGWIAVAFANNTGTTLDGFTLNFDGEQWRDGGNVTPQTMVLQYGFGSSFSTVAWSTPGGNFDWASPVATTAAGAVDGNGAGLMANRGGTVSGTDWADGGTLWLRWVETNDAGNDHGLAIDNVSLSVSAVPESSAAMLIFGGAALVFVVLRRRFGHSNACLAPTGKHAPCDRPHRFLPNQS
jgi:hypothetical protein